LREIANAATIKHLMPTPVGHALGGLAAAWFAESAARKRSWPAAVPLAIACATVAMSPDLDLLFGNHRTYTHSIGAAAAAGAIAWLMVRRRTPRAVAVAFTIAAAYLSHPLLDWLGTDSSTSNPPGLMALWPLSSRFYISGANLFGEVSRRYWKPEEFIVGNFQAVGRELVILIPVAAVAWLLRSRRTD
jgi:membrane-bound metal-dependent hydrolase YbcI (DUF457 family)